MGAKTPRRRNKADGRADSNPKSQPPPPNFLFVFLYWVTGSVTALWARITGVFARQPAEFSFGDGELPTKKKKKVKKKKKMDIPSEAAPATDTTTTADRPQSPPPPEPAQPAVVEKAKPKPKKPLKAKADQAPPAPRQLPAPRQPPAISLSGTPTQPETEYLPPVPAKPELELACSSSWFDQVEEEEEAAAAAAAVPKPPAWQTAQVPQKPRKSDPQFPSMRAAADGDALNWQQKELMRHQTTAQAPRVAKKQEWQSVRNSEAATAPSNLPADASKCLWVGGVSLKANAEDLTGMFSEHGGEVIKVKHLKEKKCAFVTMDSKESAAKALQMLDDKTLIDRRLVINFAKELPEQHAAAKPQRAVRQPRIAQSAESVATNHLIVEAAGLTKKMLLEMLPSGSVIGLVPKPKSLGGYFVDMTSVRAAIVAKKTLEEQTVSGAAIRLSFSKGRPSKQLWIGNLSPTVNDKALTAAFAAYGPVTAVDLLPTSHCAFVWMETESAARHAADGLHSTFMGTGHTEYQGQSGLPIKVNFADKREARVPGSNKPSKSDAVKAPDTGNPADATGTHAAKAAAESKKPDAKKAKVEKNKSALPVSAATSSNNGAADPAVSDAKAKPNKKQDSLRKKKAAAATDDSGAKQDDVTTKAKPERKKIKVERRKDSAAKVVKQADDQSKVAPAITNIPLPKPKPASATSK